MAALSERANALGKEIAALVRDQAPALLQIPGCGELTAAKLYGETTGVDRFADRQLNAALHRIAVTQLQRPGLDRAYYDKRLAAGDSTTEALRCLKRRLARVVFNTLKNNPSTAAPALPAAAA